ncbi:MAG: ABC transporter permease subunit [Bacillota bacterium]|nr:ABC transporter permease subunit [Bacillota bacterium]
MKKMRTKKTSVSPVKARKKRWTKDDTELTLLSVPTLIWYFIFCYLPMFGVVIAFKNYKLSPGGHGFLYNLFHSEWAGFSNFEFFFSSNAFSMLLRNTILYNIVFIIISASVAVGGALMLSSMINQKGSKIYQTMMFLPYFMSWVVVSYFVYALLTPEKGYLNGMITALGGDPVMWYQEAKYWPFILVLLNTWKGMGYGMVMYLASITGIDPSLYEAAVMDGATKRQQMIHITLPGIKPVFVMMLILDCGKIFNSDFGLFYQVTGGIPASLYETVSTFDTYVYNAIQSSAPIGQTAAASFFQAICSCGTILLANWVVSKIDNENRII